MPNFVVELTSKTIFGPFNAASEMELRNRLLSGYLRMSDAIVEEVSGTTLRVKELKDPYQHKL